MKHRLAPMHLALLAVGGAVLVASVWWLTFLPLPPVLGQWHGLVGHLWALRLRILVFGGPFAVGGPVALWAQRQLRNRFLNDEWSPPELEGIRRLVQSAAWQWAIVGMIVLAVVAACLQRAHAGLAFVYVLLLPAQMAQTIRRALFPASDEPMVDPALKDLKPMRSEHWGGSRI